MKTIARLQLEKALAMPKEDFDKWVAENGRMLVLMSLTAHDSEEVIAALLTMVNAVRDALMDRKRMTPDSGE